MTSRPVLARALPSEQPVQAACYIDAMTTRSFAFSLALLASVRVR